MSEQESPQRQQGHPEHAETAATPHERGPDRERGPSPTRNPAKTDEPFTERVFGTRGVRIIHFLIYSSLFTVVAVVTDVLFAFLATLVWLVNNAFSMARGFDGSNFLSHLQNEFTSHLFANMLSLEVILAAILVSILVTLPIYYWNEVRYSRGEWVRTFL